MDFTDQDILDEVMIWLLGLRETPQEERDEIVENLRAWLAVH